MPSPTDESRRWSIPTQLRLLVKYASLSARRVYALCEDGAAEDEGEGDDAVPSFREWELPSAAFHQVRFHHSVDAIHRAPGSAAGRSPDAHTPGQRL